LLRSFLQLLAQALSHGPGLCKRCIRLWAASHIGCRSQTDDAQVLQLLARRVGGAAQNFQLSARRSHGVLQLYLRFRSRCQHNSRTAMHVLR
jgi:hypothetical protein